MKLKTFTIIILNFLLCLCLSKAKGQSWQWAKVDYNLPTNSGTNYVDYNEVASDNNGNIYTISNDNGISIPGHIRAGYSGGEDLCIISYDCQGNYRWSKIIEGGRSMEIRTDKLGGIYVTGVILASTKPIKLDEDTMIGLTPKNHFIAKFDTSGHFKWFRMPEPDTLRAKGYDYTNINMCVAPNGDVRILTMLQSGVFCDSSYIVTDTSFSMHVLAYDAKGNFIKGNHLDVSGGLNFQMQWDYVYDKYYLISRPSARYGKVFTGDKNLAFGKFDNLGNNEWVKIGLNVRTDIYTSPFFNCIQSDDEGSVYISCTPMVGEVFDGYTFSNESGKGACSAILKYDKDGNRVWTVNSKAGGGEDFKFALSNKTIAAFGPMSNYSYIKWATGYEVGHSFKHALLLDSINIGNFFVRINATTGSIINVDSILGSRLKISTVCANSQGGFYLSGTIGNYFKKIAIPNKDTLLSKYNLKHPFLIKYGANDCGKLDVPIWAKENKKIKIYPNPSSDFIIIENAEARSTVRLYNTLGQMLLQTTLSQNQERINIQNLLSGIYIVEFISDDNHIQRTKLMKW